MGMLKAGWLQDSPCDNVPKEFIFVTGPLLLEK
jgi:hypothetical protein